MSLRGLVFPLGRGEQMRGIRETLEGRNLTAQVRAIAAAALDGSSNLEALLAGGTASPSEQVAIAEGPVGPVWLDHLRVTGFQGIGQPVELNFDPQPGLTLLIGRNGAGKSSLAEALQISITRTSSRWEGKTKAWKDGWRNLHAAEEPSVETSFVIEESPERLNIRASWGSTSSTPRVSIQHGTRSISDGELGWNDILDVYRPFLAYTELGALLGGKSTVAHDALMRGLNLSELDAAIKTLRSEASARSRVWTAALDRAEELRKHLEQHDDDRAARCAAALAGRQPKLEAIAEILSGTDLQATHGLETLRAGATMRPVDVSTVERASEELMRAVAAQAEVTGTEAGKDLGIAELLARAVAFHSQHGETDCPVCGEGRLDDDWIDRATQTEQSLRARATAATSAERRLERARQALQQALPTATPTLSALAKLGIDVEGPLRGLAALISVRNIEDDRERASAAIDRAQVVDAAFASIRTESEKKMRAQEDVWRQLHPRIVAWYHEAREAEQAHRWHAPVKEAQKALEEVLDELRHERWTPIAEAVVELWEELRINSNVEVGSPQLMGSGTSRRVDYELSVDGTENAALGVMSQGELTALALALFLPRVTLPNSPFKFLILDDPVQSMDMSRVDGLAKVLHRLSKQRQIIVLTHDERLREALLRQQIPATVHRVSRAPNSVVSVRQVSTPWEMHMSDAFALSAENIAEELGRASVPVLGRLAIESKCIHLIRGRVVHDGGSHDDADEIIEGLPRLTDKVAYARFGVTNRVGELYTELNRAWGGWSVNALKACSEGAHGEFSGDARRLAKDVQRFLQELA